MNIGHFDQNDANKSFTEANLWPNAMTNLHQDNEFYFCFLILNIFWRRKKIICQNHFFFLFSNSSKFWEEEDENRKIKKKYRLT